MFRERAHAWQAPDDLFRLDSWMQVLLGQGVKPEHYHHLAKTMSDQDLNQFLTGMRNTINRIVERMPAHQDFLNQHCKANDDIWQKAAAGPAS